VRRRPVSRSASGHSRRCFNLRSRVTTRLVLAPPTCLWPDPSTAAPRSGDPSADVPGRRGRAGRRPAASPSGRPSGRARLRRRGGAWVSPRSPAPAPPCSTTRSTSSSGPPIGPPIAKVGGKDLALGRPLDDGGDGSCRAVGATLEVAPRRHEVAFASQARRPTRSSCRACEGGSSGRPAHRAPHQRGAALFPPGDSRSRRRSHWRELLEAHDSVLAVLGRPLLPSHFLRFAALLKSWVLGTHQGSVSPARLQSSLEELTSRFNPRRPGSRRPLRGARSAGRQAARRAPHRAAGG